MPDTNFQLENNDGSVLDFREYQANGYLLLVFFRGVWCNFCKQQLKELNNLLAEFTKLGIKILAISSDTQFKSSLLKSFLKLGFPVLSDADFKVIGSFDLKTKFKNQTVSKPAIFLISSQSEIVYQYIGEDYDDRLSGSVLLAECRQRI